MPPSRSAAAEPANDVDDGVSPLPPSPLTSPPSSHPPSLLPRRLPSWSLGSVLSRAVHHRRRTRSRNDIYCRRDTGGCSAATGLTASAWLATQPLSPRRTSLRSAGGRSGRARGQTTSVLLVGRACVQSVVRACVQSVMRACVQSVMRACVQSVVRACVRSVGSCPVLGCAPVLSVGRVCVWSVVCALQSVDRAAHCCAAEQAGGRLLTVRLRWHRSVGRASELRSCVLCRQSVGPRIALRSGPCGRLLSVCQLRCVLHSASCAALLPQSAS